MLRTRITEAFGLRYPVLSAPMSLHSGGRLAGAVSRAGGLGLFGAINLNGARWLTEQLALARDLSDGRPYGAGFITHLIPVFPDLWDAALAACPPVLAFSFADPTPWVKAAKDAGARVICQVQTPAGADLAVAAGTDVLVAQGNEAGGHTGTANLMPLLLRLLRDHPRVPVLAAGGIGHGRGLAAVLAAGADGAWLGTPFLATPECVEVPDSYKTRLVSARSEDTRYTRVFDLLDVKAYGIPDWPPGIAARVVNNPLVERWHGRERELAGAMESLLAEYRAAGQRGDPDGMSIYAGESVDFVNAVRPAADVLADVCAEAEALLAAR